MLLLKNGYELLHITEKKNYWKILYEQLMCITSKHGLKGSQYFIVKIAEIIENVADVD